MASILFYQSGDDDNTILRKLLENQAQVIAGNLSYFTTGGGGGTPGGIDGDLQYNNAGSFGGYTPAAGIVAFLQTPSSANLKTAVTDETGSGALVFANTPTLVAPVLGAATGTSLNISGVNTFVGSTIRTPSAIAIVANAGTWDTTKGLSTATNGAATTLTPSTAGTAGQFALVNLINSDGSNARVFTFDTATDFNITAAANKTTSVMVYSDGTGWLPYGGSPSLLDAAADTTPATTKLIGTWDATSGVLSKTTISQLSTVVRASIVRRIATFALDGAGSAITAVTIPGTSMIDGPFTLTGWSISATGATGTITVKFWNKAYSTAIPTVANVINSNGVSLTTGTSVYSTTISDFTDTVYAAQDQFRCAVTAVDGAATDLTVTLYGTLL